MQQRFRVGSIGAVGCCRPDDDARGRERDRGEQRRRFGRLRRSGRALIVSLFDTAGSWSPCRRRARSYLGFALGGQSALRTDAAEGHKTSVPLTLVQHRGENAVVNS
jgi:hypothetical protein